jgi:hypothetical protein
MSPFAAFCSTDSNLAGASAPRPVDGAAELSKTRLTRGLSFLNGCGARHRHWRIIDNACAAGDVGKGYLDHETITLRQKRGVFGLISSRGLPA